MDKEKIKHERFMLTTLSNIFYDYIRTHGDVFIEPDYKIGEDVIVYRILFTDDGDIIDHSNKPYYECNYLEYVLGIDTDPEYYDVEWRSWEKNHRSDFESMLFALCYDYMKKFGDKIPKRV